MQRKLFFFLERLQITRNERITVATLLVLVTVLGALNLMVEQKAVYNEEHYEELERVFGERSRQVEAEHNKILARYQPETGAEIQSGAGSHQTFPKEARSDTVDRDNQKESGSESDESEAAEGRVNINTASAEELQLLPGIGPAYASRIVQWREMNGNFTSTGQLIEIRGIGPKRLEALKPLVTVGKEPD